MNHAAPNGAEWTKYVAESQDDSGLGGLRFFANLVMKTTMRRGAIHFQGMVSL
jgi:hypothetical protein